MAPITAVRKTSICGVPARIVYDGRVYHYRLRGNLAFGYVTAESMDDAKSRIVSRVRQFFEVQKSIVADGLAEQK